MRDRVRAWVALAALAVIAFVLLIPNTPVGRVPAEDEGVFLYTARLISQGGMPYRDVWDHKPPGVYLIDVIALALGGQWGVWLTQLVALVAAAWLSYRALAGLGPLAAFFGTVAWLVAFPRLALEEGHQTNFSELYALPFQFGALYLFARDADAGVRRRWGTNGALLGAALLLKPTVVGIWLAIVIVLALSVFAEGRWRIALARVAWLAGGVIAVTLAAGTWLAAGGALGEALDVAVRYNLIYSSFASPADRVAAVLGGIRLVLPPGLAILAAIGWALAVRGPRAAIVTVCLIALPLELVFASAGRGYHYYFLSWLPAMGVLAGHLVARAGDRFGPRVVRLATAAALVAMTPYPALLTTRLAIIDLATAVPAAAEFIRANSAPGETVLIWGSRTEVLVLAERRAPTRFAYQYAPLATRGYGSAARIDELVAALQRSQPVLIVDASSQSFDTPPLDRSGLASFRSDEPQYEWPAETVRVIDFVAANYQRAGTIPGTAWPVWRLRSP